MPAQPEPSSNAPPTLTSGYLLPVLATVTALSTMAAATAVIGIYKDVYVMRESLNTLIKNSEDMQGKNDEIQRTLQNHEIRLTRGKL
jgi:hypothetical protein